MIKLPKFLTATLGLVEPYFGQNCSFLFFC